MTFSHLALMRLLSEQQVSSQREVSRQLGLSLGKAHYLIQALLERGLVKAQNFSQSDNKVAYRYLLTPQGMKAKIRLTRTFLRHKEAEFENLHLEIKALRAELSRAA